MAIQKVSSIELDGVLLSCGHRLYTVDLEHLDEPPHLGQELYCLQCDLEEVEKQDEIRQKKGV